MNNNPPATGNAGTDPQVPDLNRDSLLAQAAMIICPACGGENPADAVFCGNHS